MWAGGRKPKDNLRHVGGTTGVLALGETVTPVETITSFGKRGAAVRLVLAKGDITKLPEGTREDLIVVSCAPLSYVPTPTSVVGALERIGISVEDLAGNKQEDLRATTKCWISMPLPDTAPYKQLMCLEAQYADPHSVVSNVFRSIIAMAPEANSVIMPILMSGAGGGRMQKEAVEGTVRAFHAWTRRGLKIDRLTIVMYRPDDAVVELFRSLDKLYGKPDEAAAAVARGRRKLLRETSTRQVGGKGGRGGKQQFGAQQNKAKPSKNKKKETSAPMDDMNDEEEDLDVADVASAPMSDIASSPGGKFRIRSVKGVLGLRRKSEAKTKARKQRGLPSVAVSFAEADADLFALVKVILTTDNPRLQVVELRGTAAEKAEFALETTERLIGRARTVIAIITPDFLSTAACLDHYNVALYMGEGHLVPVLARAAPLPRYMTLVQYLDAKPGTFRTLFPACMAVLTATDAQPPRSRKRAAQLQAEAALARGQAKTFDVFISYSQQFAQQAKAAQEILQHMLPTVRVFIDTVQLRGGGKWQKTLYDSLDASRVVLALLSPAYFTSKFCADELAIAKLLHDERRGALLAVRTVPWPDAEDGKCPAFLQGYLRADEPLHACCARVVAALKGKEPEKVFIDTARAGHARKIERLRDAGAALEEAMRGADEMPAPTVVIVAHAEDAALASELADGLESADNFAGHIAPIVLGAEAGDDDDNADVDGNAASKPDDDNALLDNCTIIVPLLSDAFVANADCMSALHLAIFRNRQEARCLVPIVARVLDPEVTPSFVRLLPAVAVHDAERTELLRNLAAAAALAALGQLEDDAVLPIQ